MNFDRKAIVAVSATVILGACTQGLALGDKPVAEFGEANRQTMMAQVIDPDPQYETLVPETSGERTAAAVERHATDKVKKPKTVRTVDDN